MSDDGDNERLAAIILLVDVGLGETGAQGGGRDEAAVGHKGPRFEHVGAVDNPVELMRPLRVHARHCAIARRRGADGG